jgi:hypothetical protein
MPRDTAAEPSGDAKGRKRPLDFTKRTPAASETKVRADSDGVVGRWGIGRPVVEEATFAQTCKSVMAWCDNLADWLGLAWASVSVRIRGCQKAFGKGHTCPKLFREPRRCCSSRRDKGASVRQSWTSRWGADSFLSGRDQERVVVRNRTPSTVPSVESSKAGSWLGRLGQAWLRRCHTLFGRRKRNPGPQGYFAGVTTGVSSRVQ